MEELEISSSKSFFERLKDFNWEEVLHKNRVPLALFLFGAIMLGLGVFFVQKHFFQKCFFDPACLWC